jgi:hypothetical protein
MVAAILLICLWGILLFFFILLVRIGAKSVPIPPSIESKSDWARLRTGKVPLHTSSSFVLNPRRSNSF